MLLNHLTPVDIFNKEIISCLNKNIDLKVEIIEKIKNSSDKNMLLFFTGKWCSPCRIMKREVFADDEVEKLVNDKVIPITINIDNPKTKEIVQYFKVGATPTTIIVNSNGEVLDYAVGKMNKKEFLEMLKNTETK